jgi:hypothetical protein
MYSSTLSLTSALDGVGGQRHAPAALPPGKRPGTHCTGGWLGPRADLDECGKSNTVNISRNDQQYALIVPLLYSIHWLLHVSAVACHHQGAC